ncbi:hypothetical protein [Ideonella sp.]|uniref:hypothetical protein n=1 Tax=Ideonella sp. TaxID=1929293 RepID=UPI003BB5FF9F
MIGSVGDIESTLDEATARTSSAAAHQEQVLQNSNAALQGADAAQSVRQIQRDQAEPERSEKWG